MKPHLVKPSKRTGPSMSLRRQAVRLFRGGYAPREVRKANMRRWLSAVESLGDAWLFAKPIKKPMAQRSGT